MNVGLKTIGVLAILGVLSTSVAAEQPAKRGDAAQSVRIGAVAYAPSTVTVFQGLTQFLNERGFPCDYVLYSNYDALVGALHRGEVHIAWNTPLAHAQYHVLNGDTSQTLVMRDVDFGVRSTLIVRTEAGIDSVDDLRGKRLVLGSSQAAESTVLPMHFLKGEGVDCDGVTIVSLDHEFDSEGNPCASPWHVLEALRAGRGEAGIITSDLWEQVKDEPSSEGLVQIWTSPPFSHCVFTAAADFEPAVADRFTRLMTAMDPDDPKADDVMRLEGTKRWLPGSPEGFEDLVEALHAASR
jgi:ABC-type phosphate/phosphonate transport system substrate-binding protein